MGDEPLKVKRKAKTEDVPDKRPKLETSTSTFEVQPEVENFQREALWRSLQDYKRRATQSQEQLDKLKKTSTYHDDHLRLVDVWWDQLIDEIHSMLPAATVKSEPMTNGVSSTHLYDTMPEFQEHLTSKRRGMISSITSALDRLRSTEIPPSSSDLESQNRDLMARLKLAESNLKVMQAEKEEREPKILELQDRLSSSQRKIDRQKSITLARIEQQARKGPDSSSPMQSTKTEDDVKGDASASKTTNGATNGHISGGDHAALTAAVDKHLKELNALQIELAKTKEAAARAERRLQTLGEDDIQNVDIYKTMKKANEHLRGQAEFHETRHQALSKEVTDLKSERSTYRSSVQEESAAQLRELSSQLSKMEEDLARVRSARDELHSSLQIRKGQDDLRAASAREISELADTQATRISALEAEVARLKQEYDTKEDEMSAHSPATIEELRTSLEQLQRENKSLKNELPTMEHAFNQANEQNMRKIMDLATAEEKVSRLQAEKSKADQKYFAAMKAKDQLTFELKAAKMAATKGSEAVTRLNEAAETSKERMANLEKQLAALEEACEQYKVDLSKATAAADELRIQKEANDARLKQEITRADGKDMEVATVTNTNRATLQELQQLKSLYDAVKSTQSDNKVGGESDQMLVYKAIAMCSVCSTRWKNTALTSCGHVFCKECIDKRVETRQRRCPNCNKGFGSGDVLTVHL